MTLHHFGAFAGKQWRENAVGRGRRDGVEATPMKRGVLAVLTLLVSLVARPVPAAEQALAVYEVTRVWPGGPRTVVLYVIVPAAGDPGVMAFIGLTPAKGGGWTRKGFAVGMYNATDTRLAAYGAPVATPPLPCPGPEDVCGKAGKWTAVSWELKFTPAAGSRFFLVGPPDKMRAYLPPQWRLRQVALGARVVSGPGERADAAGAVVAGRRVEAFHRATAPGGAHGSAAFAMAPCDAGGYAAGSASLKSDGSDPAKTIPCTGNAYAAFSGTADGRVWTLTGPVVGEWEYPFRLLVIDYPKR